MLVCVGIYFTVFYEYGFRAHSQAHKSHIALLHETYTFLVNTLDHFAGYGSLTPKTVEGKIVTMAYAMIGVPLMLMCLSNLGRVLAESVRQTYARLCIRQSDHYKCTTVDGSGSGSSGSNGNSGNSGSDLHRNTYHSADEKNEVSHLMEISFFPNYSK